MSTPIGGSNSQYFTPTQLSRINAAMRGETESPFKAVPASQDGPQDVIIMRAPGEGDLTQSVDPRQLHKQLAEKGVEVQEQLETVGVTAKVDQKTAEKLEKEGYLVFDNRPRDLWPGLPKIQVNLDSGDHAMPVVDPVALTKADSLHQQGITGKGQVVAVLDSGFDHPQYDLLAWQDVVDGSPKPIDPVGHGTHVAGDVLATAPDAKIVAVRVMDEKGQGRPSDIIRGLQWTIQNKEKYGIEVINMSLGAGPDGLPDRQDPINRAVELATRMGMTVVAAGGNSGPDARTLGSPADSASALTVGATLDRQQVSDFSSRGPTDDGLTKPDVMAPGEFIVSWSVPGSEMEQTGKTVQALRDMSGQQLKALLTAKPQLIQGLGLPRDILRRSPEEIAKIIKSGLPPVYIPEEGLVAAPGTSFAAPLVAGIVAGLEQANDLDPRTLKEILRNTADPMPGFSANEQGKGFVDAQEALDQVRQRS